MNSSSGIRLPGFTIAGLLIGIGVAIGFFTLQQYGSSSRFICPGGLIFIGLTLIVYLIFTAPRVTSGYNTHARAARTDDIEPLTLPHQSVAGVCWQCGSRVRASSAICGGCGAAQRRPRT
jgi:hypothetical protein